MGIKDYFRRKSRFWKTNRGKQHTKRKKKKSADRQSPIEERSEIKIETNCRKSHKNAQIGLDEIPRVHEIPPKERNIFPEEERFKATNDNASNHSITSADMKEIKETDPVIYVTVLDNEVDNVCETNIVTGNQLQKKINELEKNVIDLANENKDLTDALKTEVQRNQLLEAKINSTDGDAEIRNKDLDMLIHELQFMTTVLETNEIAIKMQELQELQERHTTLITQEIHRQAERMKSIEKSLEKLKALHTEQIHGTALSHEQHELLNLKDPEEEMNLPMFDVHQETPGRQNIRDEFNHMCHETLSKPVQETLEYGNVPIEVTSGLEMAIEEFEQAFEALLNLPDPEPVDEETELKTYEMAEDFPEELQEFYRRQFDLVGDLSTDADTNKTQ